MMLKAFAARIISFKPQGKYITFCKPLDSATVGRCSKCYILSHILFLIFYNRALAPLPYSVSAPLPSRKEEVRNERETEDYISTSACTYVLYILYMYMYMYSVSACVFFLKGELASSHRSKYILITFNPAPLIN